jgi:hypothetical protein
MCLSFSFRVLRYENMALMTVVFEAADAAETARVEITS